MTGYEFVVPFTVFEEHTHAQGDEADLLFEHLNDLVERKCGLAAVRIDAPFLRKVEP